MTNLAEIDDFKKYIYLRYSNNQIIAITALKMTVELPVNITMPLFDEIPVHKALFRLKCPGLADNAS